MSNLASPYAQAMTDLYSLLGGIESAQEDAEGSDAAFLAHAHGCVKRAIRELTANGTDAAYNQLVDHFS